MTVPGMHVPPRMTFLCRLQLQIGQAWSLGDTPLGSKRYAGVSGGSFEGPGLRGTVCEGADWIQIRGDGARQVDVRLVLKTDDDVMIALVYQGYRLGSDETLASDRAGRGSAAHAHWYHVTALFECDSPRYDWLNRVVAVGQGTRVPPAGPVYDFYAMQPRSADAPVAP